MPKFDHLSELERLAIVRYLLTAPADFTVDDRTTEASHVYVEPKTCATPTVCPATPRPWGTLVAIDLATGTIDWQVPLGEYLSHPGLGLGAENVGGSVVTASGLVFLASTPDMKMRAFGARDGPPLWEANLWAAGYPTPAVYPAGGRQFVVIAAGGGRLGRPSARNVWRSRCRIECRHSPLLDVGPVLRVSPIRSPPIRWTRPNG